MDYLENIIKEFHQKKDLDKIKKIKKWRKIKQLHINNIHNKSKNISSNNDKFNTLCISFNKKCRKTDDLYYETLKNLLDKYINIYNKMYFKELAKWYRYKINIEKDYNKKIIDNVFESQIYKKIVSNEEFVIHNDFEKYLCENYKTIEKIRKLNM